MLWYILGKVILPDLTRKINGINGLREMKDDEDNGDVSSYDDDHRKHGNETENDWLKINSVLTQKKCPTLNN